MNKRKTTQPLGGVRVRGRAVTHMQKLSVPRHRRGNYEHILKLAPVQEIARRSQESCPLSVEELTKSESNNQTDLLPKASETERLQGGLGEFLN